jgi:hypothetical protein
MINQLEQGEQGEQHDQKKEFYVLIKLAATANALTLKL